MKIIYNKEKSELIIDGEDNLILTNPPSYSVDIEGFPKDTKIIFTN